MIYFRMGIDFSWRSESVSTRCRRSCWAAYAVFHRWSRHVCVAAAQGHTKSDPPRVDGGVRCWVPPFSVVDYRCYVLGGTEGARRNLQRLVLDDHPSLHHPDGNHLFAYQRLTIRLGFALVGSLRRGCADENSFSLDRGSHQPRRRDCLAGGGNYLVISLTIFTRQLPLRPRIL